MYQTDYPRPCPDDGAYLFVHFAGNRPTQERLRFALSDDGFHFEPLFGGKDAVLQQKGTGCVRETAGCPTMRWSPGGRTI